MGQIMLQLAALQDHTPATLCPTARRIIEHCPTARCIIQHSVQLQVESYHTFPNSRSTYATLSSTTHRIMQHSVQLYVELCNNLFNCASDYATLASAARLIMRHSPTADGIVPSELTASLTPRSDNTPRPTA